MQLPSTAQKVAPQAQTPELQLSPGKHAWPHVPQFCGSASRSVQRSPPQFVCEAEHPAVPVVPVADPTVLAPELPPVPVAVLVEVLVVPVVLVEAVLPIVPALDVDAVLMLVPVVLLEPIDVAELVPVEVDVLVL